MSTIPFRYRLELAILGLMLRYAGWVGYTVAFIVAGFIGGWTIQFAIVFVVGVWGGVFLTAYNRKRDGAT